MASTFSLYAVANTDTAYAQDIDQIVSALQGAADAGPVAWFAPIAAPGTLTAAPASGSGSLTGAYQWVVTFITGTPDGAGALHVAGETAAGTASTTVTLSAQNADLTAIPIGPTGTIGRRVYRTKAGGSTFYYDFQISDNTTTSWTDSTTDASLGAATAPTANTTGTAVTFGAGATLPSGQTLTNGGTITGGVVNPASGTVSGAWTVDGQFTGSGAATIAGLLTASGGVNTIWTQATNSPTGSGQGAYLGWNVSGYRGETDFLNNHGAGSGGWEWRYWTGSAWSSPVASLQESGAWTMTGFVTAQGGYMDTGNLGSARSGVTSSGTDAALAFINTSTGGLTYWWDSGADGAGIGAGNFAVYSPGAAVNIPFGMNATTGKVYTSKNVLDDGGGNAKVGSLFMNNVSIAEPNNSFTQTTTNIESTGFGTSHISAQGRHLILLNGFAELYANVAVYRSTVSIPASGAAPNTGDVQAYNANYGYALVPVAGVWIDFGLSAGTTYYYYVTLQSQTSGQSAVVQVNQLTVIDI